MDAAQDVLRGVSDLAIVTQAEYDPLLRFEPWYQTTQYLICAKDHDIPLPEHIDFEFLSAFRLIVPQIDTYQNNELETLFQQYGKKFYPFKRVKYFASVLSMVQYGLGYGIVNEVSVINKYSFRAQPISHLLPPRCFGILSHSETALSQNAKTAYAVMQSLKQNFSAEGLNP